MAIVRILFFAMRTLHGKSSIWRYAAKKITTPRKIVKSRGKNKINSMSYR
jgi:hypothetical protein